MSTGLVTVRSDHRAATDRNLIVPALVRAVFPEGAELPQGNQWIKMFPATGLDGWRPLSAAFRIPRIGVIALATARTNQKDKPAGTLPDQKNNPTDNTVQLSRSRVGGVVVVAGDAVIAAAALGAIFEFTGRGTSVATMVAILTSAFTAISTMTTAYFGIKTISNTAQSFAKQLPATPHKAPGQDGQAGDGHGGQPSDGAGGQPGDGTAAAQADDGSGEPSGDHEPHSAM